MTRNTLRERGRFLVWIALVAQIAPAALASAAAPDFTKAGAGGPSESSSYSGAGGMVCDGVSDDSEAFQRALDSGDATLSLPAGVCRIAKPSWVRRNIELIGHATTLVFDFVGVGLTGSNVRIVVRDLIMDGNDKAFGVLYLERAEFDLDHVVLRNVYDRTRVGAKAFACVDCVRGTVRDSAFDSIRALGNGVEGDATGAARAIYLAGSPQAVRITGSRFTRIHSVDAAGEPAMEDADAIHVAAIGLATQVHVENNVFADVGKRAIKFQCDGAVAKGNVIRSAWRDDRKVMFAAVQLAGSRLTATGNTVAGGRIQHGIEVSDAAALPRGRPSIGNVVEYNTFNGAEAGDTGPYGLRSGVVAERQSDLRIVANRIGGFRNGILVRGGSRVAVVGNDAEDVGYCVASEATVQGPGDMTKGLLITDNRCVGRARAVSGVGAYVAEGAESITIAGNSFSQFTDGVDVRGKPVCRVSDNSFEAIKRRPVRDRGNTCADGGQGASFEGKAHAEGEEVPGAARAGIGGEPSGSRYAAECSGSTEGLMWRLRSDAGERSTIAVCTREPNGRHAWRSMFEIGRGRPAPMTRP